MNVPTCGIFEWDRSDDDSTNMTPITVVEDVLFLQQSWSRKITISKTTQLIRSPVFHWTMEERVSEDDVFCKKIVQNMNHHIQGT